MVFLQNILEKEIVLQKFEKITDLPGHPLREKRVKKKRWRQGLKWSWQGLGSRRHILEGQFKTAIQKALCCCFSSNK